MHLCTAEEGTFTRLSTTFRHELHAGGSLLLPSRHVTKRTFDRNRNQTYSPSAALHLKIWLLAFRETDSEVSDIRCHFMTRVMGSHFFTRDSRRSAASQARISRGLRVECDRSMLALVLQ